MLTDFNGHRNRPTARRSHRPRVRFALPVLLLAAKECSICRRNYSGEHCPSCGWFVACTA
jgi:hypothetical protein